MKATYQNVYSVIFYSKLLSKNIYINSFNYREFKLKNTRNWKINKYETAKSIKYNINDLPVVQRLLLSNYAWDGTN